MTAAPADIVNFWLAAGPKKWFARDDAFDEAIRRKFEDVHHAAARSEYAAWQATPTGAAALVLLLDQFPRNLYRNSAHAYATDPLARAIARRALAEGCDRAVDPSLRAFFYLPFEHAEDIADQDLAVSLYEAAGDTEGAKWAHIHRDIIVRFGRFPHRNAALGRDTSPDEQAFLDEGGFAG